MPVVFDREDLPFPRSLPEFQKLFPDDAACAAYLEAIRWRDGFVCGWCSVPVFARDCQSASKRAPGSACKKDPCGNCHGRRGRAAGGRGAPGVAQRPTDVRCTGA